MRCSGGAATYILYCILHDLHFQTSIYPIKPYCLFKKDCPEGAQAPSGWCGTVMRIRATNVAAHVCS